MLPPSPPTSPWNGQESLSTDVKFFHYQHICLFFGLIRLTKQLKCQQIAFLKGQGALNFVFPCLNNFVNYDNMQENPTTSGTEW